MTGKKAKPGENSDDQDPVLAWLNNQSLEHAEAYARRGRHLRGIETEELKRRWIELFRHWAVVAPRQRVDHTERMDIEAELSMRGDALPDDEVAEARAALVQASMEAAATLDLDPERKMALERELRDEIHQFLDASKTARKN